MARVDREVVSSRIERVVNELDAIDEHRPSTLEDYLDSVEETRRYALEHRLLIALQAMLDLATHVAAVSDYQRLDSYADAMRALSELGVLSKETATALQGVAGMRNAIAHGYLELDHAMVFEALGATEDMRRFCREVMEWAESR